jgi:hypothetical protein
LGEQALGLTSLNHCFQWQLVKTKPKPGLVFLRIGPEPESGIGIFEKKIVKIDFGLGYLEPN